MRRGFGQEAGGAAATGCLRRRLFGVWGSGIGKEVEPRRREGAELADGGGASRSRHLGCHSRSVGTAKRVEPPRRQDAKGFGIGRGSGAGGVDESDAAAFEVGSVPRGERDLEIDAWGETTHAVS